MMARFRSLALLVFVSQAPLRLAKVVDSPTKALGSGTQPTAITSSACWIPSQSVSRKQQEQVLSAFAQHSELLMAQPSNCWDTASAAGTCASILYYPDPVDLQRGDGLWNKLGPAIEQILASGREESHLTVLVDGEASVADVQARLENSAQDLLPYLVSDRPVTSLRDVFARIEYVSSPQQALEMCLQQQQPSKKAKTVAGSSSAPRTASMTPANLAAARRLGIDARRRLDETMDTVRAACTMDGEMRLVSNFGELCRSALTQAQLDDTSVRSPVAQQMKDYLHRNLEHSFADLFDEQLVLLEAASFEAFKQKLSKVIISPNLPADMLKIAQASVREFAQRATRMAPPGIATAIPTAAFRRRLRDYVHNRTLQARATNKFKPLPRKAISVGFHWLLPKPFGNDYRQEPWMVHATEDLTYVPSAKVTDVSPDQVATGTWRDAIVPLPAGNDMVYMQ